MRRLLGLTSVVVLLAGCSSPADSEVMACQDFFSRVPSSEGAEVYLAGIFEVAQAHEGTSIGRAVGEYGRNLELWIDDTREWGTTGLNDDFRLREEANLAMYTGAIGLKNEVTSRCDDLLTGR